MIAFSYWNVKFESVWRICGPAYAPSGKNAPKVTAAVPLSGMHSVSSGAMYSPTDTVDATYDATIRSGRPLSSSRRELAVGTGAKSND